VGEEGEKIIKNTDSARGRCRLRENFLETARNLGHGNERQPRDNPRDKGARRDLRTEVTKELRPSHEVQSDRASEDGVGGIRGGASSRIEGIYSGGRQWSERGSIPGVGGKEDGVAVLGLLSRGRREILRKVALGL